MVLPQECRDKEWADKMAGMVRQSDYERGFKDGQKSALDIMKILLENYRETTEIKPATVFLKNDYLTQLQKIKSELDEAQEAIAIFQATGDAASLHDAGLECVDIQTAAETLLAILGFDGQQRTELRRECIEKNRKRGYYGSHENAPRVEAENEGE